MPKLKPSEKKGIYSDLSQNGFPKPKKAHCFQCQKEIWIKFVLPRQEYSQKNDWVYWTGERGKKKICDPCLLEFYHNKPLYWNTVKNLKKRQQIRTYIYHGIIAA
ncbi:hypothetical protein [endosymbiont GvMRE of Glomus versiforme]|uniref:hypothetical protein n=1 Tax=endosymbiont GvMRE of Glomus versiforme TaxID=2039283 RepID=UPI000EEF9563|nr:hypothetical protein [endosymbiont GvMRE of Glomus versiforme]RHZ36576.1 hypothetical protein GvMRE_I2g525 [endosymbiont GvMRE of Glomus versiforme]